MAESYTRLRSKLDRAICAYLVSAGCGSPKDILPNNSVEPSTYPNTTVRSTISKPEVPLTGLRRIMVHISIKGSATVTNKEPNQQLPRVLFDRRVSDTYDAMMQSDDDQTLRATARAITAAGRALAVPIDPANAEAVQFAANNADMTEFTCQGVYDAGEGDGMADADGCSWEEILMFEITASPSNTD